MELRYQTRDAKGNDIEKIVKTKEYKVVKHINKGTFIEIDLNKSDYVCTGKPPVLSLIDVKGEILDMLEKSDNKRYVINKTREIVTCLESSIKGAVLPICDITAPFIVSALEIVLDKIKKSYRVECKFAEIISWIMKNDEMFPLCDAAEMDDSIFILSEIFRRGDSVWS